MPSCRNFRLALCRSRSVASFEGCGGRREAGGIGVSSTSTCRCVGRAEGLQEVRWTISARNPRRSGQVDKGLVYIGKTVPYPATFNCAQVKHPLLCTLYKNNNNAGVGYNLIYNKTVGGWWSVVVAYSY